jgi:3',5'-cyclic AMP phosphodiesterase CpdA
MAFIVGDFYYGDPDDEKDLRKQAAKFLEEVARLKAQWYPVMGNHEAEGLGWAVARELIFGGQSTYYSFDHGESHFIILDAHMPDSWLSLSEEQIEWLEDDLEATAKPHVFVFVHPPLYPTGPHLGASLDADIEVRDKLAALLKEHEVDAVFCGHEHYYCSFEYRGLMQVTTGGAGSQPLHDYEEFHDLEREYGYSFDEISRWKAAKEFHYVIVEVKGTEVEIAACDLEGDIIDQFSLLSERALSPVP